MPLKGNIFHSLFVGPLTLAGEVAPLGPAFRIPLTCLSTLGAALMMVLVADAIIRRFQDFRKHKRSCELWQPALILAMVSAYCLPILLTDYWFDRYLLLLIPVPALLVFAPATGAGPKLPGRVIVITLLLLYGGFSVLGVRDYLGWNRQRWEIVSALEKQGIDPLRIDGGFEVNSYMANLDYATRGATDAAIFRNHQAQYLLSFSELSGDYVKIEQYALDPWLPTSPRQLYLYRKTESGELPAIVSTGAAGETKIYGSDNFLPDPAKGRRLPSRRRRCASPT